MIEYIDDNQLIPMRLITGEGYVRGATGAFEPLAADSFISGYVDLDDLLATDDLSFQSILIHFLTERFQAPDYERLIGTDFSARFPRAHRAGHTAQAEHFQSVLNDPSIRFNYEEPKSNGDYHIVFKSHDHGYRVFMILRDSEEETMQTEVRVRTSDRRWLSVDDFLAEREAAAGH